MQRNKVENRIRADVLEKLKDVVYDPSKDTSLDKFDAYGPLSKP
jgi:hypothetical protein